MKLSAKQRKELFDALLEAFTPNDFDRLLLHHLDKRRHEIVSDSVDFRDRIDKVIEDAEKSDWLRELVDAALKERPTNEGLRNFIEGFLPPSPPAYAHILFISMCGEMAHGPCDTGSAPLSQQFDLIKAEAVKQQGGDPALLISEVKDWGVAITTFGDPKVLLRFAFHIAQTIKSPQGERLRMAIHRAASATEKTGEQPTEPPPEGIYIARRLVELGSAGHILATYETGEFLKRDVDFELVFNNKFDALFHVARNRELWPRQSVDVYNIYFTTHDGDGHPTTVGNEQSLKTRVPERVICNIKVPRTLKELREEKINVTFWPDLPYVEVKFEFEDKKESNIKISSDLPESEECRFECDFENHNFERQQVFDIKLINKAKNRLVVLKLLCSDRYGREITQDFERPIRLRRYLLPYWWDRFWFSRWYFKVALVLLASLIGYAGYHGYRYMNRPDDTTDNSNLTEPEAVTEMPSVLFTEGEELLRQQWDFSGQSINLEAGIGGDPNKALVVTGPQRLLINPSSLGGKTFKDFVVLFAFKLRPGSTQAGWIFRASPDKKKGYIFILERQLNGQFLLHVTFDEGDGNTLQLGFRQVLINTCRDDDWIIIRAKVHGNTFSHRAWIKSQASGCPSDEQPITPDFEDDRGRSPYGNVGILVPDKNEVLVDHWVMGKYEP